jgi:hypothetical protein
MSRLITTIVLFTFTTLPAFLRPSPLSPACSLIGGCGPVPAPRPDRGRGSWLNRHRRRLLLRRARPGRPARDVLRRCYTGCSLLCQGEMLPKF